MSSNILRIVSAEGRIREISLDQLAVVPAEAGAVYAVVDAEGKVVAEDVQVSQVENDLVVEVEEQAVARIEDFYSETGASSFSMGVAADGTAAQYISSADAMVESSDVAWSADSETLAAVEAGGATWPWLLGGAAVIGGGIALANNNDSTPAPAAPATNTNVVLFDLTAATPQVSGHSNMTFDPNVSYSIYIMVPTVGLSPSAPLQAGQLWSGLLNLGADDTVYLVGDAGAPQIWLNGTPSVPITTASQRPGGTHFWSGSLSGSQTWLGRGSLVSMPKSPSTAVFFYQLDTFRYSPAASSATSSGWLTGLWAYGLASTSMPTSMVPSSLPVSSLPVPGFIASLPASVRASTQMMV